MGGTVGGGLSAVDLSSTSTPSIITKSPGVYDRVCKTAKPTTKSGLIDDSMIVAIPYWCSSSLSHSVQQLVSPVL